MLFEEIRAIPGRARRLLIRGQRIILIPKGKKADAGKSEAKAKSKAAAPAPARPSALLDTRVIYCGDCLEQLKNLPDAWLRRAKSSRVGLIGTRSRHFGIDPPFNSNRNYEVFWGETKEKRASDDRHVSTQAYIDYMRPRCVELARVLGKTGSFYYHCDRHASHYVKVNFQHAEYGNTDEMG